MDAGKSRKPAGGFLMATQKLASKKAMLAKRGRRTRWAPFWATFKAFGKGKKVHPSKITSVKRNWRRTKLGLKPVRMTKSPQG